jgi:hypothetical protein
MVKLWSYAEVKHGKHNQATHGRKGRAGRAGAAAYKQARAGGASLSEARAAGKAATAEERAKEKQEKADQRRAGLVSRAEKARELAGSDRVTEAQRKRYTAQAERLEARARGERVGATVKPIERDITRPSPEVAKEAAELRQLLRKYDTEGLRQKKDAVVAEMNAIRRQIAKGDTEVEEAYSRLLSRAKTPEDYAEARQVRDQMRLEVDRLEQTLKAKGDEAAPLWQEINRIERNSVNRVRSILSDRVRGIRSDAGLALTIDKRLGDNRKNIKSEIETVSSMVSNRTNSSRFVDAVLSEKLRSSAAPWLREVYLNPTDTKDVIAHEFGHLFESDPRVLERAVAFRNRRTVGEPVRTLNDIVGAPVFRPDEVSTPDQFMDSYIGKRYVDPRNGRDYATEVISMGVQYMRTIPAEFAARDPDMFDFIYSVMVGDNE